MYGGFRHIGVGEGLPSSEVYRVMQDSKGYIWMTTDEGVCKYNGYSFQTYTTHDGLTDDAVFDISEDVKGRIWVQGLSGAVSYFEGGRFHAIPGDSVLKRFFHNGQLISYCLVTDSACSVTVGGGYTGGCFRVTPSDHYTQVHPVIRKDAEKYLRVVWLTHDRQVLAYGSKMKGGDSAVVFMPSKPVKICLSKYTNTSIADNRFLYTADNRMLVAHCGHLFIIDPSGKVSGCDYPSDIIGLNADRQNNIWVLTRSNGVQMYPAGDFLRAPVVYLDRYTISDVFEDNDGGYWFSSIGEGVFYLPDIHFNYLTMDNGLPKKTLLGITPFGRHGVVIGMTDCYIALFNPRLPRPQPLQLKKVENTDAPIECVAICHDTIMVNVDQMDFLDTNLRLLKREGEKCHYRSVIRNPVTGELLFSGYTAIGWFDAGHHLEKKSLITSRFTALAFTHEGQLWVGTLNSLYRYAPDRPAHPGDSVQGLNMRIDGIAEDRNGFLWVATRSEGVFAYKAGHLLHYSVADGLASNSCRCIITDSSGGVWVGTNAGISRISNFDSETGKTQITSFSTDNGLLSDEVKCLLVHNGQLLVGSNEGLCWIDTAALKKKRIAPPVYITQILFDKKEIRSDTIAAFRYGNNTIRVFCEGLCYSDPEDIRYRYRLLGGSNTWITTENREISFTGLRPGDYSLEVYAVNGNGVASKKPAIFRFSILSPFWQTAWFYVLITVVLVVLTWLVAGYRVRRIRTKSEEKIKNEMRMAELRLSALRAQMNPHFIFNAINSIQHFILHNDSEQAYNYLSKFSRLIRLVLEQSQSDTIPLEHELEILNLYIELEKIRFDKPFACEMTIGDNVQPGEVMIPGMLIQPFVENAIWHGLLPMKTGEPHLLIRITRDGNDLLIVVDDNGVGRSDSRSAKKEERRSFGLLITEERLRIIRMRKNSDTSITITDKKDADGNPEGTRVEVRLRYDDLLGD